MLAPHTPEQIKSIAYKKAHILVVDDDETNCLLLEKILKKDGFHNIAMAPNGEAALEAIEKQMPDLILLDIIMPGDNGLEFCKKLKASPKVAEVPVVFLSGLEGVEVKTKAFKAGGVDYISKPYHKLEVLARVNAHIRNGLTLRKLSEYNRAIRQELTMAEHFQRDLLPSESRLEKHQAAYGINIAASYLPCTELAGDYWAFLPINENTFGILMCDFSGHGVPAALETVRFHSLLQEFMPLWETPKKLLTTLNKRLTPQMSIASFATLQYAVFRTDTRTIDLWGAGAPPVLHLKNKEGFAFYDTSGLPIGIDSYNHDFSHSQHTYAADDIFLFYSDALSEASYKADCPNLLKAKNISDFMSMTPLDAEHVMSTVLRSFLKAPEAVRNDDLTLVALQLP